jgi:hypothetical protein
MEADYWIGVIFWGFIWGMIGMAIGQKKGIPGIGFFIGFLLGPIGVLLTLASKGNRIKCPFCKQMIDPKALICPHCRSEVSPAENCTAYFPVYEDELLKIKQLFEAGTLTVDEYKAAKARILNM